MIQGFKRSKYASAALMGLSALIAVLVWFQSKGHPFFVPLIASALMLGIGYFSSRVLGNILASTENTRYLGYLHMELDPEKFITAYAPIPGRMKPGSSDAAICRSYLADGYAAAGDFEKALALLAEPLPADNIALAGLYASNQAVFCLQAGKLEEAHAHLARLEEIVNGCRLTKPALAQNLDQNLSLYRQYERCLTGKAVDTDYLKNSFEKAQYNLRRLEITQYLARHALREGNQKAAQKHLTYLMQNGGKTFYHRWAKEQ